MSQMDPFTAVFNGHVNNADKRAREFMRKRCPTYLKVVEDREREGNGIMAIFNLPRRTAFVRYALLVQKYVNEGAPVEALPDTARDIIESARWD